MKEKFTYPAIFEYDSDSAWKDESFEPCFRNGRQIFEEYRGPSASVRFPDLPGCFSAGDNFDEAYSMASEALKTFLEWLIEENRPLPTPGEVKENLSKYESFVEISAEVDVPDASAEVEIPDEDEIAVIFIPAKKVTLARRAGIDLGTVVREALDAKLADSPLP